MTSIGNRTGYTIAGWASSLLPLLATGLLTDYIFRKKPYAVRFKEASRRTTRIFASVVVGSIVLSIVLTIVSLQFSPWTFHTPRYVLENIGAAFGIVSIFAMIALLASQRGVYFPFWGHRDKAFADERQRMVRNRVYEKSYRILLVMLLLGGFIMPQITSKRLSDQLILAFIVSLFTIPSVIAAWQKDS